MIRDFLTNLEVKFEAFGLAFSEFVPLVVMILVIALLAKVSGVLGKKELRLSFPEIVAYACLGLFFGYCESLTKESVRGVLPSVTVILAFGINLYLRVTGRSAKPITTSVSLQGVAVGATAFVLSSRYYILVT